MKGAGLVLVNETVGATKLGMDPQNQEPVGGPRCSIRERDLTARDSASGATQKGLLRPEFHLGHIEVVSAHHDSFKIVTAGSTFYKWIGRSADTEVSLFDLIPAISADQLKATLQEPGSSCECEDEFVGADKVSRALRFRVCVQEKAVEDSIRIFVVDISELKRKDSLMRSVSSLLDANRSSLQESQKKLKTLLDSIPQVIFSISRELKIASESSLPLERMFGAGATGKFIDDVLPLSSAQKEALQLAFSGVDWGLVGDALPREIQLGGRTLSCAFLPTNDSSGIVSITAIIEDTTDKKRMQDAWERTNAENRALIGIASSREEFLDLFFMARDAIHHVNSYAELSMLTHSLKGGFAGLECHEFAALCHAAEDNWVEGQYTPEQGRDFVECLNRSLDRFLNAHRDVLQLSIEEDGKDARRSVKIEELALKRLYNAANECQIQPEILSMIEGLAEKPVSRVLAWLDNTWQKTLVSEGKEGNPITWVGGEVRIAREPYRQLFQSFVHIIRNTVDHGIEAPDERALKGKTEQGNLSITTKIEGDTYFITFRDDGRGIDPQAVLRVAMQRGMKLPDNMSQEEIFMLLAAPGLSSKSTVTELSGRGIGLDVVRYEAKQLGGDISIRSEIGQGAEIVVWFKHRSGLE